MKIIDIAERGYLPDLLIRYGIRKRLQAKLRSLRHGRQDSTEQFASYLNQEPIAIAADLANDQHYEVECDFFDKVLGPRMKYSCCLYQCADSSLQDAETAMLKLTCERAAIHDGMEVLDLGCGWGSLSLWIAENYPNCKITAVSNSSRQRDYIVSKAHSSGFSNLNVVTANIINYNDSRLYDRIISVEMFEHMRNYEQLLGKIRSWIKPDGLLFVHIFCHQHFPYTYDADANNEWMAKHFFTGGIMPSFDLLSYFDRDFSITQQWKVNGMHYARTCEDWLSNLDRNQELLKQLFSNQERYGSGRITLQRWRMFFMACSELFRYSNGQEWFVSHYCFQPTSAFKKLDS